MVSKSYLAAVLSRYTGLKRSQCFKVLACISPILIEVLKATGKAIIAGICIFKTKMKAAQKARYVKLPRGCRVRIDAKPAKLIATVRPAVALKRSIAEAPLLDDSTAE